jgi:hypothetical protein
MFIDAIASFNMIASQFKNAISCYEFRLHNDFAESLLTRGLSPLPVCVLDN